MVVAHNTKDDLLYCWTSTRTFTKDTALSEQGRGTAWAQHAMCESAFSVLRT